YTCLLRHHEPRPPPGLARVVERGYYAPVVPRIFPIFRNVSVATALVPFSGSRGPTVMMSPVEPAGQCDLSRSSRQHSLIRGSRGLVGLAGAALLVLAGCGVAERFPQTSLDPKSDLAIEIDNLWNLTLYLVVGVSVIVFAILAYILYHCRYQPDAPEPDP